MFKALESGGLRGFLGCKSVLYEPELEQFFDTALIQGGDITGAISGKYFSISPSMFAGVFELPTEGLSDFSDVPKNLVYDARKLFSKSGEPIVPHGKKKLLNKVLFGVLEEMVDRTVKKAKGYRAKISILLNRDPALTMGEATPFPADTRGQSDEGGKMPVAIVKRASKSKKKSESTSDATVEIVSEVVGSKKRPAVEGSEPVVPKKRRTTKGKASASTANMDMEYVAQGAVPLQVIEPTPAVTAALPPVPKRNSRKRKLILSEGSDDDYVEESIGNVSHVSAEQMFTETDVGDIVFGDSTADNPEELAQWLENYISEGAEQVNESDSDRVQRPVDTVDVEQLFETRNVKEAEGSKHPVVEKDLAQAVGSKQIAKEFMSIDDLLLKIPDDMLLPSVTAAEITKIRLGESISINEVQERDLYYASLPRISTLDKGKEILEEDEPVKGNPARETVELICGDVEFLVQLRDMVMKDVVEFFHSFSLNKLSNFDALLELKEKEKLMLEWAETDSLETAVKRKMYILAKLLPESSGFLAGLVVAQYKAVDTAIHIEEGMKSRSAGRAQVAQAVQVGRPAGQGAQSSQSSQSAHFPQQQQQQQVAQQSGRQRFRPHGQQFKKKSGSGSSGSGSSSSSGSRAEFCGFCGGNHSSTQCVGVQGSCNLCGQYGHFARVCPTAGAQ
ncbi:hypothetical protein F511_35726 [Dorcoceras hygrometricum]|uniref:CCHC-type domain-containing protein n=1 Tax=Dorcoceras hygrometricum TaxID=472368 RepID=A0A2Z7AZH4_9LAMI|nr:hypothetical protein F511_35726 [Dorcoceras hygrometricum]